MDNDKEKQELEKSREMDMPTQILSTVVNPNEQEESNGISYTISFD
ncbi:MAG: hypothetical protein J6M63_08805 [Pseudobutyrivibrio sp.]|nr:hypothetical protein [Pseudobutyrivibrio sp.]MBO6284011.1 hypothetical protein [Pseudobutyrivibrio sp.]MBP3263140.1 hypothetical protein [Pseudobutyrivibrio sp.]